MKLALLTYLVLTLPGVADFLITLFAVAAFAWVIAGLAFEVDALDGKLRPAWLRQTRHLKWMIPVFALCILVPSKEDAKVIAGVYIASEAVSWVSEVEGVAQLPGNLVEFINNKLVPAEED